MTKSGEDERSKTLFDHAVLASTREEQSDKMNTDLQKYVQSDLEAQEKIDAVASKFEEMLKVAA